MEQLSRSVPPGFAAGSGGWETRFGIRAGDLVGWLRATAQSSGLAALRWEKRRCMHHGTGTLGGSVRGAMKRGRGSTRALGWAVSEDFHERA